MLHGVFTGGSAFKRASFSLHERTFDHATVNRGGTVGENSVGFASGSHKVFLGDIFGNLKVRVRAGIFMSLLTAKSILFRPITRLPIGRYPIVSSAVKLYASHIFCAQSICGASFDAEIAILTTCGLSHALGSNDLVKWGISDNGDKILTEAVRLSVAHAVERQMT